MPLRRFSLLSWLLVGVLLLSLGLNALLLVPRHGGGALSVGQALFADDDDDDDDWFDDDGPDEAYGQSRAALADELRRTRQQLASCQHAAAVPQVPRRTGAAARAVPFPLVSHP